MHPSAHSPTTPWQALAPQSIGEVLAATNVRWWLSGGAALDRWLGRSIRTRRNVDVSVAAGDVEALVSSLPECFSAWVEVEHKHGPTRYEDAAIDANLHPLLLRDDTLEAWVLQVNIEDGAPGAWVYRRDPRLQLPWERAVVDIDGVPTGAPEVQLVWKALRPRPEDEIDKNAVLPHLSKEAHAWYERAILSIHPHSTWSINVRSPFAPAKPSWKRSNS